MPILGLKAPGPSNPSHFSLEPLIRSNILALQPYRCARDDYSAGILLDANENALGPSLPALAALTKSKSSCSSEPPPPPERRSIDEPITVESAPTAAGTVTTTVNGEVPPPLRHTLSEQYPDWDRKAVAEEVLALLTEGDLASLNRYPSPTHDEVKQQIAKFRGVENEDWVFLGVGSDEVIDMLFRWVNRASINCRSLDRFKLIRRVLCVPGRDKVMTTPPTYGMYKVTANVNDVGVVEVPLITDGGRFELDEKAVSNPLMHQPPLPETPHATRSVH